MKKGLTSSKRIFPVTRYDSDIDPTLAPGRGTEYCRESWKAKAFRFGPGQDAGNDHAAQLVSSLPLGLGLLF